LVKIAQSRDNHSFYGLQDVDEAAIRAFQMPALSPSASQLLGLLGTQKAQLALVEFASQNLRDLQQRQAAAAGFRSAVQRRRLLLTTKEISRQYDRYNASASADKDTQQLLGAILDTIERKGLDVEKDSGSKAEAEKPADSTS